MPYPLESQLPHEGHQKTGREYKVGATAIRAAFASSFRTGPVGKTVNIGSERALIYTFGTPAEANAADWLVAAEFLRYGGQVAVVRAATAIVNATESGTGVLIGDEDVLRALCGICEP